MRTYFKNFYNFLNEEKVEDLVKKAKKLKKDAEELKDKGNNKKAERLLKKSNKLIRKAKNKGYEEKKEDKNRDKKTKKPSDKELMSAINRWNENFAQNFKFKRDEPKNADIKDDNIQGQSEVLRQKLTDNYKSSAMDSLEKLVNLLLKDEFENSKIRVIGFTSSTGSDTYNKSLSLRRSRLVINAIKDKMLDKNAKDFNNIQFIVDGYGEDENRRVVINDYNTKSLKVGTNYNKNSIEAKLKGNDSKEARRELNRRVEIALPNIEPKYSIKTKVKAKTKEKEIEEKEIKKPESPDSTEITFNPNSYILKEKAKSKLKEFSNNIKKWNEKEGVDKIDNIYITAHTYIPRSKSDTSELFHLILSANRASMVRRFLKSTNIGVEIEVIPVAYTIPNEDGDDKRVEIKFEENEFVKKAKVKFAELAEKHNIDESEGYYDNDDDSVIKNTPLRRIILRNIKADKRFKIIPPELWNEDLGKLEKNLERFKNRVRKNSNMSDEDIKDEWVFERD